MVLMKKAAAQYCRLLFIEKGLIEEMQDKYAPYFTSVGHNFMLLSI